MNKIPLNRVRTLVTEIESVQNAVATAQTEIDNLEKVVGE